MSDCTCLWVVFVSGVLCNSKKDWSVLLHMLLCWSIQALFVSLHVDVICIVCSLTQTINFLKWPNLMCHAGHMQPLWLISRWNTDINILKIDVAIIMDTEVHIPVPQGNISTGFRWRSVPCFSLHLWSLYCTDVYGICCWSQTCACSWAG